MNKNKLRAEMVLHGDTVKELAKAMGMCRATFYSKLNGDSDFKQSEIGFIQKRYSLDADAVNEIFFNFEVS
ncbi:helix-turn-helix domain-containing protein [Acidaminococcus massiliensis]|uniref:helix-turn-helix domain-containing protein n=1 Tax=Acidaminococcus massiliensis TaxID=1852375 RepID=UPI0023F242CD|nr:helix-turn-helix domain-containing protein [Acidaminococcus massiliensis]